MAYASRSAYVNVTISSAAARTAWSSMSSRSAGLDPLGAGLLEDGVPRGP
ncbi:hypothetical protein ACIQ6R_35570 [Streptomyces sp. NPDC096048]